MLNNRLTEAFPQYRRIWVQYCTLSKRRSEYRAVITLFPLEGTYTMLFSDIITDVNFETISTIIENNLQSTN